MNKTELYDSFLLKQFYDFYVAVIRQKKAAKLYVEVKTNPGEGGPSDLPEKVTLHPIHLELRAILNRQVVEARKMGGEYGVAFYMEAQYVMAALADEVFVHMDWEGKQEWRNNLLEFALFGTYVAGESFFKKIDKLLKQRDPAYVEMAAIYLMALSLGFKGKYKDSDDGGQIEFYQRQLFAFVFQKDPDLLSESRRLIPQAAAHTLARGAGEKLPYLKWWLFSIFLVILVFLILQYGIWVSATSEIAAICEKILSIFRF